LLPSLLFSHPSHFDYLLFSPAADASMRGARRFCERHYLRRAAPLRAITLLMAITPVAMPRHLRHY
jgi:hypothetical protein